MVNEEIVGTDINMDWALNAEGDVSLVTDSDNMAQQIYLRLTAYFDSLWWCYDNYGSYVKDWLGKNNNEYTRSTLITEIEKRVLQDPRVKTTEVELKDWTSNYIGVRIKVTVENKSYEEYFIFGNIERKNDDVHHTDYKNTYIDTRLEGYYAKPGEILRVHCHVFDETDKRVPIGEVSLKIGKHLLELIDLSDNPQEIAQSGTEEPGSNTYEFRLPPHIKYGDHDLIFHYKGIRGFNSSTTKTTLHVVDRIPTSTHYIYPRENYGYYYANDVDDFTDSKVYINDYNDMKVTHGEVEYYLNETHTFGEYAVIDYPIIFLDDVMLNEFVYIRCKSTVIEASLKYIFELNRMFHTADIIEVIDTDGTHLDNLECVYKENVYFLTSTELVFSEEKYRGYNGDIKLKVLE